MNCITTLVGLTTFAILPCISALAVTGVATDRVDTGPSVPTRGCLTMVNYDLTFFPSITARARAPEVIHEITTRAAIFAWVWGTVINIDVARFPAKTRHALTGEIVDQVLAQAPI